MSLTRSTISHHILSPSTMTNRSQHTMCSKNITEENILSAHNMSLDPEPFELISRGQKTIELRLLDEKRRNVHVGDIIRFTNSQDAKKTLDCKVIALHIFSSFDELYAALPLEKCGYANADIPNASPSDMQTYYSLDKQKLYDVVGIEVQII